MEKYHKSDVCPIEKENERDENYKADNPQIDSERTLNNFHTVMQDESYTDYINRRLKENNLKPRKDAVLMCSFVIGSDGEFFKSLTKTEERKFFYDATAYFANKYGRENIISAIVHKDETTPHLHLNLIPIDNNRLCAKDLFCPKNLRILQTELYEKAGKKYGLERGKENSQAKHLSTAEFKAKKIIEQAEEIKEEVKEYADALKQAHNGEFPKNKNKLKEQVIALVAENKDLNRRLEISMKETLQFANENRELRKDNERKTQGYRIAAKLQKENPREFDRIVYGKPIGKNLDGFFASVLSMFTPEVTSKSKRLKEIEEEIEDERDRQNRLNGNYYSK
ncbi:MAG: plasmid recombination protein [Clostridia bacterium]|nr:plasmid recombination protein [Clostridia bacterium]